MWAAIPILRSLISRPLSSGLRFLTIASWVSCAGSEAALCNLVSKLDFAFHSLISTYTASAALALAILDSEKYLRPPFSFPRIASKPRFGAFKHRNRGLDPQPRSNPIDVLAAAAALAAL